MLERVAAKETYDTVLKRAAVADVNMDFNGENFSVPRRRTENPNQKIKEINDFIHPDRS
jgi:hypothetical protein